MQIPERVEIKQVPERGDIKKFSNNLEFYGQGRTLGCFVNPVSRKYDTGLNAEDLKYLEKQGNPYNVTDVYMPRIPHEFWDSTISKITLKNSPVILFPKESVLDFIRYKYLLQSKYVYNSLQELENGGQPQAYHYLYEELEETKSKATKIQKKNALVNAISKLSPEDKRNYIFIILNENTENKNEEYLTVRFEDILSNKDLSDSLESLINNKEINITLKAQIKSAIHKNVLKRTKAGYFFFDNNLGLQEDDVYTFLQKVEGQETLLKIIELIK